MPAAPRVHFDWETACEVDLKARGLDVYSSDPSARVLMGSYGFDDGPVRLWDATEEPQIPAELKEAIEDPHVEKWCFNAQFERTMARRVLKLKTGYTNWRCSKVLGHMHGFTGDLDSMGKQLALDDRFIKDAEGKRLIKMFTMPQKVTAKKPLRWLNSWTDPVDWDKFCNYCIQDTVAERDGIYKKLIDLYRPDLEWELYEEDQRMNDRGLPMDMQFVQNAKMLADRRRAELTRILVEGDDDWAGTQLRNPNSPSQLLAWLKERGYPFDDLRKDTVKKVLAENAEKAKLQGELMVELGEEGDDADIFFDPSEFQGGFLHADAVRALRLRQQVARTSVKKYDRIIQTVGPTDRLRFTLQFHGASRTGRDAGRIINPQNLSRPPGVLEITKAAVTMGVPHDAGLDLITNLIRDGDEDGLKLAMDEPMNALAGVVRSAIRAPDGYEFVTADLSSIETVVIGWLSGCERLLNVFRNGLDAYKDFGTQMYKLPYEEIVGKLRQNAKPGVLGCGFRLSAGEIGPDGKKTGLWGYAEAMGIQLTQEECQRIVHVFRKEAYPEIPYLWYALEDAAIKALREDRRVSPVMRIGGIRRLVPVVFEKVGEYLTVELPVGDKRKLWYHRPRIENRKFRLKPDAEHPLGKVIEKESVSYMGKMQNGNAWVRIHTHGGKWTENIVQAIAREILFQALKRAKDDGFKCILRVHDELVALVKRGDNYYTLARLIEHFVGTIQGLDGIPLGAAGWTKPYYRKD